MITFGSCIDAFLTQNSWHRT